jgi:hypothetical protein
MKPEQRMEIYASSSFDTMQRTVTEFGDHISYFLGFPSIFSTFPVLRGVQRYSQWKVSVNSQFQNLCAFFRTYRPCNYYCVGRHLLCSCEQFNGNFPVISDKIFDSRRM